MDQGMKILYYERDNMQKKMYSSKTIMFVLYCMRAMRRKYY